MRRRLFLGGVGGFLAASPARAEIAPFGRGSWQALRTRHAEQPTLVHFWGLTCAPCLAELPDWGRFAGEHPDAKMVFVAADPVPMPPDAIAEALTKAGLARVESWAFEGRFATRLYYEVDPSWQGELPRTQLIGRDGGSEAWIGTADFPRIRAWLNREIRVGSPS